MFAVCHVKPSTSEKGSAWLNRGYL